MAIRNKYYTGSTVSRDLPVGERSFAQVVYQSGKPVLDAELNQDQDVKQHIQRLLGGQQVPSGFLKSQTRRDNEALDYEFVNDTNTFYLNKIQALVAGFPITVEYSNTDTAGKNKIVLDVPTVYNGTPPSFHRTDFVFLEVWQSLVSPTPSASGTIKIADNALIDTTVPDKITITDPSTATVEVWEATFSGTPTATQFTKSALAAPNGEIQTAASLANQINTYSTLVYAFSNNTDTVTIISRKSGTIGNGYTVVATLVNASAITIPTSPLTGGGPNATNKPDQDHIYRHGNTQSSVAVAVTDDLKDPIINTESTKRVQVQYRIRVFSDSNPSYNGVNFKNEADGFSNAGVLAQGGMAAPVAQYQFCKADGSEIRNNSSAVAYDEVDNGLFIAGDGSSASAAALGTVDGFVYAIPICFIFRRNDASSGGFDPQNNAGGGLLTTHTGFANTNVKPASGTQIPAGVSDRPDGMFPDRIYRNDLLDLRRHVSLNGIDLAAELQYQMKCLLDGNLRTWSIDAADKNTLGSGSGDISVRYLVCDEIGRDTSHGGSPALSGDTQRGNLIRNFDHIARRFGDQPVNERFVLPFAHNDGFVSNNGKFVKKISAGSVNWVEGDELHFDMENFLGGGLGDYTPTYAQSAQLMKDLAPPGTVITDVLVCTHDDGHFNNAIDQTVQIKKIEGLGTPYVIITLDLNNVQMASGGLPVSGSNPEYRLVRSSSDTDPTGMAGARRIFIEFEISYPAGYGLTDTPDEVLEPDPLAYPEGPVLENDYVSGTNTQHPPDIGGLLKPKFRSGFREVMMEYKACRVGHGAYHNVVIQDSFVSKDQGSFVGWKRFYGDASWPVSVVDANTATNMTVDTANTEYGASSRKVVLDTTSGPSFSGAQTLCNVEYFAQDPIPNYGTSGYQLSIYYRTNAPQTCGVREGDIKSSGLPTNLTVRPLVMSHELWTGGVGMGSVELPYPYSTPLDQIAVNDAGHSSEIKEWYFMATAQISIDDFDADTGLLNLHTFVPADGTGDFTFTLGAAHGSQVDGEFRSYYHISDPSAYRPTAFTQDLSGVMRHKCLMPFLAKATADTPLFRKGEVLLMVISRWAELDAKNNVVFNDVVNDNRTCVALYRTKNLLILAGD